MKILAAVLLSLSSVVAYSAEADNCQGEIASCWTGSKHLYFPNADTCNSYWTGSEHVYYGSCSKGSSPSPAPASAPAPAPAQRPAPSTPVAGCQGESVSCWTGSEHKYYVNADTCNSHWTGSEHVYFGSCSK